MRPFPLLLAVPPVPPAAQLSERRAGLWARSVGCVQATLLENPCLHIPHPSPRLLTASCSMFRSPEPTENGKAELMTAAPEHLVSGRAAATGNMVPHATGTNSPGAAPSSQPGLLTGGAGGGQVPGPQATASPRLLLVIILFFDNAQASGLALSTQFYFSHHAPNSSVLPDKQQQNPQFLSAAFHLSVQRWPGGRVRAQGAGPCPASRACSQPCCRCPRGHTWRTSGSCILPPMAHL